MNITRSSRFLMAAALAAALSAGAATSAAFAAPDHKLTVGNDGSACAAHAQYHTIQSAVNAASAGDTIQVCPGTYQEYVFIPAGLNNLTLMGQGGAPGPGKTGAPVILFPTTPNAQSLAALQTDSLVTVDGASNVTIDGFEISGPFTDTACEPYTASHVGVYVGGGGQANILHDYVTHIQVANPALYGCQDGFGVEAGNSLATTPDVGSVDVENTTVDTYQKDGILIDGGSTAASSTVSNDTVTGIGPTAVIASNGVEMDDGSTGVIENNDVSANQYTPAATQASGILMFGPGANSSVRNNKLSANDVGIYAYQPGSNLSIQNNQVANDTTNSDSEGIELDTVTGVVVDNNQVSSGADGIDVFDGSTASTIQNNHVTNAANVGIWNEAPSMGNTYTNNHAEGSGTYDCKDDTVGSGTAGTGNTWTKDHGDTASPPGICTH